MLFSCAVLPMLVLPRLPQPYDQYQTPASSMETAAAASCETSTHSTCTQHTQHTQGKHTAHRASCETSTCSMERCIRGSPGRRHSPSRDGAPFAWPDSNFHSADSSSCCSASSIAGRSAASTTCQYHHASHCLYVSLTLSIPLIRFHNLAGSNSSIYTLIHLHAAQ